MTKTGEEAGVPFFFKQNGEFVSVSQAAGCLLDGREWKQMPEARS
jgi:protein gp37